MKLPHAAALALALSLSLLLGGCGYHLRKDLAPPAGVRTVAVPTFANRTYQPGLELPFTEQLRGEMLKGKGVQVVADRGRADAIVSGEVLSFRAVPTVLVTPPNFPQDRRLPTRYRAIVEVKVSLVSTGTGEVLWEDTLEGTEEFDAGVAAEGFEPLERDAQQRGAIAAIAQDLMREAYDRMMTDF
ncbi:MAG TPA: LptE family protein [bacterium]|nr:LptE family protein [bacterium]